MPSYYVITVQPVDMSGAPTKIAPLSFTVSNHDDLFAILGKVEAKEAVPRAQAAEFVIGLKLFLEVMIRHRKDELFRDLWPHMGDFVRRLKALAPPVAAS
jgi:hypothetical protein